jgi:tRNA A37 threonylcarbamoyladenosine synthetase subunit TsaC/SUA5/YrdC
MSQKTDDESAAHKRLSKYREAKQTARKNAAKELERPNAKVVEAVRYEMPTPIVIKKRKERHGDAIPNSMFFRAFCSRCDEPMRVSQLNLSRNNYCESCDPKIKTNTKATKDDLSPWQENAIRAMEEA